MDPSNNKSPAPDQYDWETASPNAMAQPPKSAKDRDEVELQSIVTKVTQDAVDFIDTELSPKRAEATDYYLGKPFGNEEPGRSQVVLTEVRDGVGAVLPSLLRVVFGGEQAVEFEPQTPAQEPLARLITDATQKVFTQDNNGFMLTHAVLKDGLVRKLGIFKWGWEDGEVESCLYKGLTEEELTLLVESGADLRDIGIEDSGTYTAEISKRKPGKVRVWAVPPEEFIFSRDAKSVYDATLVGHRTTKTKSELRALGVTDEEIEAWGGRDDDLEDNEEAQARRPTEAWDDKDTEAGEANEEIDFVEGYLQVDIAGEGRTEFRKIWALGPTRHLIRHWPASEIPFAAFCPDPEPHTLVGGSWADRLMDMQKVGSSVLRATLDSLALSIFPRIAYVEGEVAVEDVLNTEIGAPIRTRAPGMIQPVAHDFKGREALPVLSLFSEIIERRTGRNNGAVGLDADALQSSTEQAVTAAVTASQEHVELLSRIFCESALKPLMRGIYRTLIDNQSAPRMMKLRGEWTEVDPAQWPADLDLTVNVALGNNKDKQTQTLLGVLAKQENLLTTMGPQNPLVSLHQYSTTLRRLSRLLGYQNPDEFFNEVPADWQPPQQEPQKGPEQIIAEATLQAEMMKTQREFTIKEAELEMKREQMHLEHERELAMQAAEHQLKLFEIESKFAAEADKEAMRAEIAQLKIQFDALSGERVREHQEHILDKQQQFEATKIAAAQEHDISTGNADRAHDAAKTEYTTERAAEVAEQTAAQKQAGKEKAE